MSVGTAADSLPGRSRESTSTSWSLPLRGSLTRAPFALNASTSAGRHASVTACPAATSLMASSDP
jgi:hypothetical protein